MIANLFLFYKLNEKRIESQAVFAVLVFAIVTLNEKRIESALE